MANGSARIDNISFMVDSSKLYELDVRGERPRFTANVLAKSIEIV
jgi:hypothetical protein